MSKKIGKSLEDAFNNSQLKIGESDQAISQSHWNFTMQFNNWYLWTTLYNESWVFRNGIDKRVDGMVTNIEINSTASADDINKVVAVYDKYRNDIKKLLKQGKIYGGGAGLMIIEGLFGKDTIKKQLDISKVKKGAKMSLYIRDRWNGLHWRETAGMEALGTTDFMRPKYYSFVMDSNTGQFVGDNKNSPSPNSNKKLDAHYSFVLRGGNRSGTKFTDYLLNGWDLPEGAHVLSELTRDETTRASAASLASKQLLEIVKMNGIRGLMSGLAGNSADVDSTGMVRDLTSRLGAITNFRSNNNLIFLDSEDEYEQFTNDAINGISKLLEEQRKFTSGAFQIPEMILYGSSNQKGMIFTDKGTHTPEIEIYEHVLQADRDNALIPIMDKLLPVMWRIATGNDMPSDTTYGFTSAFKEGLTAKLERATLLVGNVTSAVNNGLMTPRQGYEEIMNHSKSTGFGTSLLPSEMNKLSDEFETAEDRKAKQEGKDDDKISTATNILAGQSRKTKASFVSKAGGK